MNGSKLNPCRLSALFLQLFSALIFLIPTAAFVHKQTNTCTRIHHHWVTSDAFRCGSTSNDNAGEYQDAYGRSIRGDATNDPLATDSTAPNLDPLVVCGPSGVGKGTVIESLRKRFPPNVFGFSVSHTTRQPRPGEVHGQHYFFTSHEDIQRDIAQGLFVEHAEVHGNYYGTSKKAIEFLQGESKITILDIDVQGVKAVKESGIPAKYVFIAPPSMEELEGRLRGRGTETEEAIQKRLGNAASEIEYGTCEGNFDHVFVNQDVEQTVDEMVEVLTEWFPQLRTIQLGDSGTGNTKQAQPTDIAHQTRDGRQVWAKAYVRDPWDFLAQADRMTQFPSVRKGHGHFVSNNSQANINDRSEFRARHHGAYTVDLEEPDGPRGYPKLGKTNPNIELEVQEEENQQRLSSYSFVDNEVPDGPRGYPRLGATDPVEFLDAEERPYQRYYDKNLVGNYEMMQNSQLVGRQLKYDSEQSRMARQKYHMRSKSNPGMFRVQGQPKDTREPITRDTHICSELPQSYPQLGRVTPVVQSELQKQYLIDYVNVDLEEPEGPRGYPKLGRTGPDLRFFGDKLGDADEIAY